MALNGATDLGSSSRSRTDQPASTSRFAATSPFGPAPTTTASYAVPSGDPSGHRAGVVRETHEIQHVLGHAPHRRAQRDAPPRPADLVQHADRRAAEQGDAGEVHEHILHTAAPGAQERGPQVLGAGGVDVPADPDVRTSVLHSEVEALRPPSRW